ncbi:hypothetical protein [Kordia sp.]
MKKSSKKMELKKRSISELNAKEVNGGLFISILCPTRIYIGEDLCWVAQK